MRRIAVGLAMVSFLTSLLLGGMWVRSYRHADRLHGRMWDRESFLIASKQGAVTFFLFTSHGHEEWWQWEVRTYSSNDEMSFPFGDVDQYQRGLGFGVLHNPLYFVMRPVQNGWNLVGAASATLRGSGVILPYWFLVATFAAFGFLLATRRNRRFGLRSLMLTLTAIVVLMGIVRIVT